MFNVSLLALALLTAGTPAPQDVSEQTASTSAEDDKMICKRYHEIGSRITNKKVCKTQKEWEEQRSENAATIKQRRGAAGGPQPGNGG